MTHRRKKSIQDLQLVAVQQIPLARVPHIWHKLRGFSFQQDVEIRPFQEVCDLERSYFDVAMYFRVGIPDFISSYEGPCIAWLQTKNEAFIFSLKSHFWQNDQNYIIIAQCFPLVCLSYSSNTNNVSPQVENFHRKLSLNFRHETKYSFLCFMKCSHSKTWHHENGPISVNFFCLRSQRLLRIAKVIKQGEQNAQIDGQSLYNSSRSFLSRFFRTLRVSYFYCFHQQA